MGIEGLELVVGDKMADEAQEEYQKSWTEQLPGLNI